MRKLLPFLLFLFLLFAGRKGMCGGTFTVGGVTFKNVMIANNDPAPYGDFQTLVIPIKRAGNLIIVEAQIDSVEGNFVMDTGAPYLVLNATYFRDLPKMNDLESAGINGDAGESFTTIIHNFSLLDLHYSRITADVTDLSAIENGRGLKILGLLGTRLFRKFAITVDIVNSLMYIHKLDAQGNIPEQERIFKTPYLKMPIKYTNDIIFLKGAVNENTVWFVFDSGAETNLLDYHRSKKALSSMQILSRSKLTGIGGSSFEVLYARFDKLTLGDKDFMRNRVLVTNLEKMGKAYDHSVDGILGYDFFSRGIFTINFVKEEFEMYIYNNQ